MAKHYAIFQMVIPACVRTDIRLFLWFLGWFSGGGAWWDFCFLCIRKEATAFLRWHCLADCKSDATDSRLLCITRLPSGDHFTVITETLQAENFLLKSEIKIWSVHKLLILLL